MAPARALQMAAAPAPAWWTAPAAANPTQVQLPRPTSPAPFTAWPGTDAPAPAGAAPPAAASEAQSRADEIGADLFAAASAAFQLPSLTTAGPAKVKVGPECFNIGDDSEEPAHAPAAPADKLAEKGPARPPARPAEALVPAVGAEALASAMLSEQEGIFQLNDLPCSKNLMVNPLDDICSVHDVMVA